MQNRNIVILAGGISSRMKKPPTDTSNLKEEMITEANQKSKSMISMSNKRPFLDYLLYNIKEAGYKNVLIVIGENDNSIKDYYKRNVNLFEGLTIKFATQYIPKDREKPFGTADALWQGLKTVPEWKDECFTVVNSDNLYSIKALKLLLESEYDNALIDYDSSGFEFPEDRVKAFAITIKNEKGFLKDIVEKPEPEIIEKAKDENGKVFASMNIFKLKYNMIFTYLENCPVHPKRNEKELPTAVKLMIADNENALYCYQFCEHVPDLTNKDDIIPVQEYLEKYFAGKLS
ncbi:MAG: nucleotidyltransferase [Ignavibacteriae bacterium]|nr:MAG: nucleotidyltransferase [Ignavibacteriota bacterium]